LLLRKMRCPKCGYETPKGKVQLRIWTSEKIEKQFNDYAGNHKSRQDALISLLTKAELYDKLQGERSRVAVEPPSKV